LLRRSPDVRSRHRKDLARKSSVLAIVKRRVVGLPFRSPTGTDPEAPIPQGGHLSPRFPRDFPE